MASAVSWSMSLTGFLEESIDYDDNGPVKIALNALGS